MSSGRVVVTGLGVISSVGSGREQFWQAIVSGKSGRKRLTLVDTSEYRTCWACLLDGPYREQCPDGIDLSVWIAELCADQALTDARLDPGTYGNGIGLCIGTSLSNITTFESFHARWCRDGPDAVDNSELRAFQTNELITRVLARARGNGPGVIVVTACAAGAMAIGQAYETILTGQAPAMLAGGVDVFSHITYAGFNSLRSLAVEHCRPFDKDRDGLMLGEAATLLLLEDREIALARGAPIMAELIGYRATCDAHHISIPDPQGRGAIAAMQGALDQAGVRPDSVDYLNAHGTATPANDSIETSAIKTVYGDHAYRLAVSSSKSMLGHTLGAAGAIESAITCLAVITDTVPPTINFSTPDPDCDLNNVTDGAQYRPVRLAMSNSFGFGGNNAALLFRKHVAGGETP